MIYLIKFSQLSGHAILVMQIISDSVYYTTIGPHFAPQPTRR